MTHLTIGILLGLAVIIAACACVGVLVMGDAFQRLQFCSVSAAFCPLLIAAAVWLGERDAQARIKVILVGLILFVMNSVLTTATAKAIRIRQAGHWEPHPDERIPIVGGGDDAFAGTGGPEEDPKA